MAPFNAGVSSNIESQEISKQSGKFKIYKKIMEFINIFSWNHKYHEKVWEKKLKVARNLSKLQNLSNDCQKTPSESKSDWRKILLVLSKNYS